MSRLIAVLAVISFFGASGGPAPVPVAAAEEPVQGGRTWKWVLWTSNCKYPCGDNTNHYNCDCFN